MQAAAYIANSAVNSVDNTAFTPAFIPHSKVLMVAGLHWETLPKDDHPADTVRRLARQLKATHFLMRTDWWLQAAFTRISSHEAGRALYSLAAAVQVAAAQQSFPKNWIGIFRVDAVQDRWWLLAIADNAILAGGDVAGSRQEIEAHFHGWLTRRTWDAVVAPADKDVAEYGIAPAALRPLTLEALLPPAAKPAKWLSSCRLIPVSRHVQASTRWLMVAGVVMVAALAVAWGVHDHQAKIAAQRAAREAEAAKLAAEQQALAAAQAADAKRAEAAQTVQPTWLPHPWLSMAPARHVLNLCQTALSSLPASPAGWSLQSASCNGVEVRATYLRGATGAPVMRAVAAVAGLQARTDGETAELVRPISPIPAATQSATETEVAMGFDAAALVLNSRLQSLKLRAPLREVPPAPGSFASPALIPAVWKDKLPPVIQDWRTLAFTLDSPYPPRLLSAALNLPALRIRQITMRPATASAPSATAGRVFTLEGEIYANHS